MQAQPNAKTNIRSPRRLNGPSHDHVGKQRRIVERDAVRRMHDDLVDQQQQADGGHQRGERIGERDEPETDEIDQQADHAARGRARPMKSGRGLDDREQQQAGICSPIGRGTTG